MGCAADKGGAGRGVSPVLHKLLRGNMGIRPAPFIEDPCGCEGFTPPLPDFLIDGFLIPLLQKRLLPVISLLPDQSRPHIPAPIRSIADLRFPQLLQPAQIGVFSAPAGDLPPFARDRQSDASFAPAALLNNGGGMTLLPFCAHRFSDVVDPPGFYKLACKSLKQRYSDDPQCAGACSAQSECCYYRRPKSPADVINLFCGTHISKGHRYQDAAFLFPLKEWGCASRFPRHDSGFRNPAR